MEIQVKKFKIIARELKAMYGEDQTMRRRYQNDPKNQQWDGSIDIRNTQRFQKIVVTSY